jgi:predicted RND superfamily exporter protein
MESKKNDFLKGFFSHPYIIVFVIAIITVFFAFQLPKAELDNNNIRVVPEKDEARAISGYIDETFGSSFFILVALERKYGDVFDTVFINRIREFNKRMEDIEIAGNISSLVSSDYIYSDGDSIIVQKIASDDFSGTKAEIAALKKKLLSWDIFRRALVSDDFRATQILIPLNISVEMASRPEIIEGFVEIRDIAREMFSGYAEVYVTGLPIISAAINESMRTDLAVMIPLVAVVVLLVLFFSFRRFMPVVLPLVTVLASAIWSMGAMPLFGVKLSVISTVLPVILVAVGSAYGIHIVTHYLEAVKGKGEMSPEEHKALILALLEKIGKAVFLAAITTLAGFISFGFTTVVPIREFSYFSTFGVLVSYLLAVTLIPSLLIIRGPRLLKTKDRKANSADSVIAGTFVRIAFHRTAVVFATGVIVLLSVWGISKIVLDNVFVEYFKTTTDIYKSDRFIREKFGGSKIISVVVQADDSDTLLMPEVLVAMDNMGSYLEENVSEVGKVMGFTDLVKRINQVFNADESPDGIKPAAAYDGGGDSFGFDSFGFGDFNFGFSDEGSYNDGNYNDDFFVQRDKEQAKISADGMVALLREAAFSGNSRYINVNDLVKQMEKLINYEGASYYEIPSDPERYGKTNSTELRDLVSNYLILLSGNISAYANDSLAPTAVKTTIQLRTIGDKDTGNAINSIRAYIEDNFPRTVQTIVGGSAMVESSLNRMVVESQIISVLISIITVFFIITISNRSFVAGLVGIAPLSICILVNFAVMGFAGIKLNIGTSMVASVSVGIGIDYTIHCIEAYKREYRASGGEGDFLFKAFASSGKAILINAVSVGSGFAVLVFSQFVMLQHLGLLIALTMFSSALASLTVIPVLLLTINPKFIHKEYKNE